MKNIRRLLIVMTFAVMALLMMTAVSFAGVEDMELKVDGTVVETEKGTDHWEIIDVENISRFSFTPDTVFMLANANDSYRTSLSSVGNDWGMAVSFLAQNFTPNTNDLKVYLSDKLNRQYEEDDAYYIVVMYTEDWSDYRRIVIHSETTYSDLNVTVNGETVSARTGRFQNQSVPYVILNGSPQNATVTRNGESRYYDYNWRNSTNSINAGYLNSTAFQVDWKNISYFKDDPDKFLEGLNLADKDKVVFFWGSSGKPLMIIIKPLPLEILGYNIDNEMVEPVMIPDGDDTLAYFRVKELSFFQVNKNESARALNIKGQEMMSLASGYSWLYDDTLDSYFKVSEEDIKAKMATIELPEAYSAYHTYYWITFTDGDLSYPVLLDVGIDPPETSIKSIESDAGSVTIKFEGDDLDLVENGFKEEWVKFELKDAEGNEYQMNQLTLAEVNTDSVKYTFSIPDTEKPEAIQATLSTVFLDQEAVTKDFTIPATKYWSVYAEEPEKIAKGDKDWPEFVNYYKITKPEELAWFALLVNGRVDGVQQNNKACAFLANDIVCNDTEGWEDWTYDTTGIRMWDCTIGRAKTTNTSGQDEVPYKGVFDGNGNAIKGLYIVPDKRISNYRYIEESGLFPICRGANIKNLGVEESFILGDATYSGSRLGGIISYMTNTTVENCWFDGTLKNWNNSNIAGGIVGRADGGCKILRCFSNVRGSGSGISTTGWGTTFEDCYAVGRMICNQSDNSTKLYRCYRTNNGYISDLDLPADNIVDCFCLDGDVTDNRVTRLTEEQFRDGTLLEGLNSDAFCADDEGDAAKNDGRPILVWQSDLYKVKKAAEKEVKYYLNPTDYSFSKAELEAAIESAVESIEAAEDEAGVNSAKETAINALKEFKSNADIAGENNEEIEKLKAQLAELTRRIEINGAKIEVAETSVVFNGKAQEPAVKVTGKNGVELKEGTDYTVAYSDNVNPGVAKVTVTGTGAASDAVKEATFKILPKKASLKKVAPAKKKLTITWAKDASVTGYEVQYSLKKNFKSAKKVNIKKAGTAKTTVKKLKSGKKYFVRVRSYKTVDKEKLYGAWSKAKNAKVK